ADDADLGGLLLVVPVQLTPAIDLDRPHVHVRRFHAVYRDCRLVVRAPDVRAALQLRTHGLDEPALFLHGTCVGHRQDDGAAGAFAAGLHARTRAPDDAHVPAELAQHRVVAAPETL